MSPNIAAVLFLSALAASAQLKGPNLDAAAKKFLPTPNKGIQDLAIVNTKASVGDLSGLEQSKKLRFIFLSGPISDLSPLKGLTGLETVTIQNGRIRDLTPLAGLTNLEYLDLSGNQIGDLSALASLQKLKSLYLSKTRSRTFRLWHPFLRSRPCTSTATRSQTLSP